MESPVQSTSIPTTDAGVTGRARSRRDGAVARPRPGGAFALLATVQVTLIVAITVILLALPAIQRDFQLSRAGLVLVSSGYGLAFAGLLLLGGRLADLLGPRRVLVLGVAVFGFASAGAGVAPGLRALLAARFVQGCGAALAAPAAMALLPVVFPEPARRARAVAVWGALSGAGATLGLLLSGLVATWTSWRWAFALPAVVAALAWLAAPRLLPAGPAPVHTRLDVPGAVLATAAVSALSYGLVQAGDRPWSSTLVAVPLAAGAALLALFVAVESQTRMPLLPPGFFASARRATALLVVLLAAAGHATSSLFLALYFLQVRGYSPLQTSAVFLPLGVAAVVTGLAAARLVRRAGTRTATATGLLVAAVGLLLLSRIGVHTPYMGPLLAGLLVFPAGAGLAFSGATVTAVDSMPDHQAGVAGGITNTAMETGPTLGLALLVSLAGAHTARLAHAGADQAAATTAGYAFALTAAAVAFALTAGLTVVALRPRRAAPRAR